jgi:hypothetical protein
VICGFIALAHSSGGPSARDSVLIAMGCGLGLVSAFCAALFIASFVLNQAGHSRAMEIADELGWPHHHVTRHLDTVRARGD